MANCRARSAALIYFDAGCITASYLSGLLYQYLIIIKKHLRDLYRNHVANSNSSNLLQSNFDLIRHLDSKNFHFDNDVHSLAYYYRYFSFLFVYHLDVIWLSLRASLMIVKSMKITQITIYFQMEFLALLTYLYFNYPQLNRVDIYLHHLPYLLHYLSSREASERLVSLLLRWVSPSDMSSHLDSIDRFNFWSFGRTWNHMHQNS